MSGITRLAKQKGEDKNRCGGQKGPGGNLI